MIILIPKSSKLAVFDYQGFECDENCCEFFIYETDQFGWTFVEKISSIVRTADCLIMLGSDGQFYWVTVKLMMLADNLQDLF